MNRMGRRATCKRNQRGGGLGGTVQFTAAAADPKVNHTVNNPQTWVAGSSCLAATRPGFLENGYTGFKGLPGMEGGRRKSRRGGRKGSRRTGKKSRSHRSRRALRTQAGGRYGFTGPDTTVVNGPYWGASYTPMNKIPCELSHTPVPAPPMASGMLNKVGGPLWDGPVPSMRGGGVDPATAASTFSISGPADAARYDVQTAGYTHFKPGDVGDFDTAAGTKVMINVPDAARTMNPACLKTGGGRRKTSKVRKSRKGSRKGRKGRKIRK